MMAIKPNGYNDEDVTEIVEKCNNLVKTEEEKYQKGENKSKCNPMAWMVAKCTADGMADACPENLKIKSEECLKARH